MNRKSMPIVAVIVLAVLAVASWQVVTAGDANPKGGEKLSKAARAGIKKAFPKAEILKVEREPQMVVIYEVELRQGDKRMQAEVFVNGEILSVEWKIAREALPKAVAESLAKVAGDAEIKELEKKEIRATISISRFPKPRNIYEAEFVKDGKMVEVQINEAGKVIAIEEEDDDEDEREISLAEVPAAVRATILKHAGKNRVHEVEVETRRGKTFYEAEWKDNGREIEIKVSAEGRLLRMTFGDDDDDDEDDDDDDDHDDDDHDDHEDDD